MARYKKKDWDHKKQRVLILIQEGRSTKDIAAELEMTQRNVQYIMNKPQFVDRKEECDQAAIQKARDAFTKHALKASLKIIELSESGKAQDRIRLDAAREVLHQCGMKPKEVIETIQRTYSKEEIQSAQAAAREVEEIATRLAARTSRFIIEDKDDPTPGVHESGTAGPEDVPA